MDEKTKYKLRNRYVNLNRRIDELRGRRRERGLPRGFMANELARLREELSEFKDKYASELAQGFDLAELD